MNGTWRYAGLTLSLMLCLLPGGRAFAASQAEGDAAPAVSVALQETPAPHRAVTVEFNPLPLVLGKVSANLVIAPGEHHAVVFNPFYASTTTAPISSDPNVQNAPNLPEVTFSGFGGELGYRYYFGNDGPRGLFLGPSLMAAEIRQSAPATSLASLLRYGLAVDIGYQMLAADRVSLALGAGLQYTMTTPSVATQQFPARLLVNGGFLPRFLLSVGVAL